MRYLINIVLCFGGCLHVRYVPVLGARLRLFHSHLALVFQVTLVPHQNEGNLVVVVYSQNLVSKVARVRERLGVQNAKHHQKPLAGAEVIVSDGGIILLYKPNQTPPQKKNERTQE